ncbi:MAG: dienelactone hydrolase family protein [Candidatus Sericytochromatia bacterium]
MHKLIPSHLDHLNRLGGSLCILDTPDGPMDTYRFSAKAPRTRKPLLFYSDAGGVRPAMFTLAREWADRGHEVLIPNLYYRLGSYAPFDAASVFTDEAERTRLMEMAGSLRETSVMQDTSLCLDLLKGPIGVVGYCLGGGMALRAAAYFGQQIEAAASVHGGGLATDDPESPHRLAPHMAARLYLGIAGIDPHFPPLQQARLEAALKAAGRSYQLEVFARAEHGFAVPDMPTYNPDAATANQQALALFLA